MKEEEIERLKMGEKLLCEIEDIGFAIADIEHTLEGKDNITDALMFVKGVSETRIRLTKDATILALQTTIEQYKKEREELQRKFDQL